MTTIHSSCRGFYHPVFALVRPSLQPCRNFSPRSSLQPSRINPYGRSFTTSNILANTATRKARPKPSRPSSEAPSASTAQTAKVGYAHALALKSSGRGTILYESSPNRLFLASSYAAGLTCWTAASLNAWINYLNCPEGLPQWVPVSYGLLSIIMVGLGTKFALMPAGIVRSITVTSPRRKNAAEGKSDASSLPPVQLEFSVRRDAPFPFVPPKRILAAPDAVAMKTRLFHVTSPPTDHEKAVSRQEDEEQRKKAREYELTHLMTSPFRDARRFMSHIFSALRRGLTGEGFAPIEVDGKEYKLDITAGYALEDGRALDRIVKIEEDPRLAKLMKEHQRR
ncbi:hypothetical protein F4778DRAFT_739677 [Xylariomycetidae sp. FL2044]|nr:hypothetical protein F4778DRAFT_739677 [Xylariomycetidae sp. FL2044]